MYQRNVSNKLAVKMGEYEAAKDGKDRVGLMCIPDKYTEKMVIKAIDKAITEDIFLIDVIPEMKVFEDPNVMT